MPAGLLLGLFASLAWGLTDVAGALAARRTGSLATLAGTQVTSLVLLGGVALASPSSLDAGRLPGFAAGLALGVVAAGAYLSFYTALRIGPISVVSPVVAAYGGATVVLAVLLRDESLLPLQAAGAVLATAGVVLTGLVFHGSLRGARLVGPGVAFAAVTMGLFAVITVALAGPIQEHGWLAVILGSRLANTAVGVALLGLATRSRTGRLGSLLGPDGSIDRTTLALIVFAGSMDLAGFVAYSIGLEVSATWLVGLASSFAPAIAVLVAVVRLGERLQPSQWLGLSMLGAGLVVLATAG